MIEHAVRREAAVALAEVRALGGRLARAGDARLRVDDDRLPRDRRAPPAAGAAARESPRSDNSPRRRRGVESRQRDRGSARSARRRLTARRPASADTSGGAAPRRAGGTRPERSKTRLPRASERRRRVRRRRVRAARGTPRRCHRRAHRDRGRSRWPSHKLFSAGTCRGAAPGAPIAADSPHARMPARAGGGVRRRCTRSLPPPRPAPLTPLGAGDFSITIHQTV